MRRLRDLRGSLERPSVEGWRVTTGVELRKHGLQLGASWTPDSGNSFDSGIAGDNDGNNENSLGLGLNYNNKIGDVGIRFGTTYAHASTEAAIPSVAALDDVSAWSIGGTLSYSGFSVGVGHGDNDDSNCTKANTLCDAGDWWDVAGQYKFGNTTSLAVI